MCIIGYLLHEGHFKLGGVGWGVVDDGSGLFSGLNPTAPRNQSIIFLWVLLNVGSFMLSGWLITSVSITTSPGFKLKETKFINHFTFFVIISLTC